MLKKTIVLLDKLLSGFPKRLQNLLFLTIGIFLLWSLVFRLDLLPGLHGDEAWFGLRALQSTPNGGDSLHGMNLYTGILQVIASRGIFSILAPGVLQLRLATVLFNLIGLAILFWEIVIINRKRAILLLLVFLQSCLFLSSARIAWEVNTFHLFFFALLFRSITRMVRVKENRMRWPLLFLTSTLIGSYNHIIFSSLTFALLVALFLYKTIYGCFRYDKLIPVSVISLANNLLVLVALRFESSIGQFLSSLDWTLLFLGMILLEAYLLKRLLTGFMLRIPTINRKVALVIFPVPVILFFKFHGIAFFQALSNEKIYRQIYSYENNLPVKILFAVIALTFIAFAVFLMAKDIFGGKHSPLFAVFILCYIGILCVYTTANSFRYYLLLLYIIASYFALRVGFSRILFLQISLFAIGIICNGYILCQILSDPQRPVAADQVTIGNGQVENSGHFLPKRPLVDFLRTKKIKEIRYLSDRYFIEQPILFYEALSPWKKENGSNAIVEFDENPLNHGFIYMRIP